MDSVGPWPPRPLVIFLSRENARVDDPAVKRLESHWVAEGWTFLRFLSDAERLDRELCRGLAVSTPVWRRRLVKGGRLLLRPSGWWLFHPGRRRRAFSVETRMDALRSFVAELPVVELWFVLGRSAGARVATRMADVIGASAVVCLSYPFKHPQRPAEPDRVAHLQDLRTPCLIVQGRADQYGAEDAASAWQRSPAIRVFWCDADHNLRLAEEQWSAVLAEMSRFVAEHQRDQGVNVST